MNAEPGVALEVLGIPTGVRSLLLLTATVMISAAADVYTAAVRGLRQAVASRSAVQTRVCALLQLVLHHLTDRTRARAVRIQCRSQREEISLNICRSIGI